MAAHQPQVGIIVPLPRQHQLRAERIQGRISNTVIPNRSSLKKHPAPSMRARDNDGLYCVALNGCFPLAVQRKYNGCCFPRSSFAKHERALGHTSQNRLCLFRFPRSQTTAKMRDCFRRKYYAGLNIGGHSRSQPRAEKARRSPPQGLPFER